MEIRSISINICWGISTLDTIEFEENNKILFRKVNFAFMIPNPFAFFHAALQFCNYQANLLRSLETGVRFRVLHIRLKQNVFGSAGNKAMYLIRMCNIIQTKHEGVAIASLFQNNTRISSHNEITYRGFIGFNLTNV